MSTETEIGRVIWHDLMTSDVAKAKRFYAELLGWEYQIEHATDFAWRPGEEADYPLILAYGEAHGGIVYAGKDVSPHWIAWVEVENVDATAANDVEGTISKAKTLGASVRMKGAAMPILGQSAVLADVTGAVFGILAPGTTSES